MQNDQMVEEQEAVKKAMEESKKGPEAAGPPKDAKTLHEKLLRHDQQRNELLNYTGTGL